MTLGVGTVTADSAASNGSAVKTTQTSDVGAVVTRASWPNGFAGVFRVFARVKTNAGQATFYAKAGSTGTNQNVAGAATPIYSWVDLGAITAAAGTALEIHGWISSGFGTVYVDRIEAYLVTDRSRNAAIYSGARDFAQSVLYDSQVRGAVVAR